MSRMKGNEYTTGQLSVPEAVRNHHHLHQAHSYQCGLVLKKPELRT